MKKARSDAILKTLHPKRQLELWKLCQEFSYKTIAGKIKTEWHIDTSSGALSEFYSWYPFRKQLEEFKDLTGQITRELASDRNLDLDSEKVSKAGQAIFETLAAKTQDSKLFLELRRLRQKDREHEVVMRRLALLEKNTSTVKEKLTEVARKGGISKAALKEIEMAARILS
jgi:hypothetical protein